MLNIQFKHNSDPITDGEMLAVVDGIRPALGSYPPNVEQLRRIDTAEKEYALLLAKMLFRIEALKVELAKAYPASIGGAA